MRTVYLLGLDGSVLAFGVGCLLSVRVEGVQGNPNPWRVTGDRISISSHPTSQEAKNAVRVWLQAIMGATDGGLLSWDSDRGCVVDELAENVEAFADSYLTEASDGAEEDADPSPVYPAPNVRGSLERSATIYKPGATPREPGTCAVVPSDRLDTEKYNGQPSPSSGVRR